MRQAERRASCLHLRPRVRVLVWGEWRSGILVDAAMGPTALCRVYVRDGAGVSHLTWFFQEDVEIADASDGRPEVPDPAQS